ncbi:MAG: SpoIIE family protein phosphatase, partial [Phycisphaerales bacterium]
DPLVRPWYIAGVENPGRQVWSEIYPWVGGDSEIPELGLGLVLTVSDEDGRLLGVHDTELSLTQISTFLMNLKTREGGSVYIVDERQGMVACSETSPLVRAPDIRVYASELQDPRGRAIAAYLNDHPQSEPTVAPRDVAINVNGEPLRVRIQPFHHPSGLRWSVWIALPESELLARTKAAQSQMIRTGLVATLLALALGLAISHFAVRPLLHLVDQIRSIGNGDFDARSEVRFTSELTTLSRSLNEVGAQLQDRLRLKQSLELAMEIQQNLLPSAPPPIDGLEVFGHSTYCDETGGDYYDYFPIAARPDSSLGIAVGDVTGHGIGAALLMATARAALRSRIGEASSLSALLEHTNAMLVVDTKGDNFMTMLLMDIDAQDRSIRWTSAGQSPPFIYCPIADAFIELSSSSLPLGVMESATYPDHHLTDLKPGTVIVLGTDGLWEAQSPTGEPFGIDRIRTVIRSNASRTAEEIGELLTSKLDAHCAHSVPSDDITFVVVRITR